RCAISAPCGETDRMTRSTSGSWAPAGYRFSGEVIAVAVRWYQRDDLSYRDVEESLAERGIDVDHVTIYRWGRTFTPEFSVQTTQTNTPGLPTPTEANTGAHLARQGPRAQRRAPAGPPKAEGLPGRRPTTAGNPGHG